MGEFRNILFATDFSQDANSAFLHALDLARKNGAKLHIFHTPHSLCSKCRRIVDEHVPGGSSREKAAHFEAIEKTADKRLRDEYDRMLEGFQSVRYVIRCGSPDAEIIRYARKNNIDVIVMGTLGKAEQDRMSHGSTAANVSKYAPCQVILIQSPQKPASVPQME